jgi:recombinational DNA repair protein RecR
MAQYIIRRVRLAHCKRGPERCEQCRAMDEERICLLDICPEGEMQRRVIQVGEDGPWREFDIVRSFRSEEEAQAYADEHGIGDVEW